MFSSRELLRQEPHKNGQRKQIDCLRKKVSSVKVIEMYFKTLMSFVTFEIGRYSQKVIIKSVTKNVEKQPF